MYCPICMAQMYRDNVTGNWFCSNAAYHTYGPRK